MPDYIVEAAKFVGTESAKYALKSVVGAGAGLAIGLTKLVSGLVDQDVRERLDATRKKEACPHIEACYGTTWAGHEISAQYQAARGNTAWKTTNGIWVYHPLPDFGPIHKLILYRPATGRTDGGTGFTIERNGGIKSCGYCDGIRSRK